VKRVGVVNFFIEDFTKYVMRANLITADDKNFLQKYAQEKKPALTDISGNKYFGAVKGKNLIIIQIESLENVVINKTIYNEEITPNINKLAKEGMYFDNYYSNIGPGNTADCEFSTMNSLYPLPNDVAFINYAKNKYNALPQLLAENGYHTYSMHGDVPTFWNRSNIYPSLGYQKIFSLEDYIVYRSIGEGPISLGPRLADEDLFNQSIPKLKNLKEPFMATLITLNSHTPFNLPDDLQTLHMPAKTIYNQPQWKYVQSIHYADKAVGEFIDALKKNGLYDNSLILIWGDHGSFSNVSDAFGKKYASPALWNSQVPMILLAPGTDLKGTNSEPGSHIDIYPTLANLLGLKAPKTIFGQDLLNTKTPVETHFKNILGGIDTILTDKIIYEASEDGIFEHGSCESLPGKKSLPIADCQNLYNQELNNIKASNIIIRGNLLDFYNSNLK
jgi:phosphoglycerol transferase MdoB-like AlkP superfamily enzyme